MEQGRRGRRNDCWRTDGVGSPQGAALKGIGGCVAGNGGTGTAAPW